MQRETMEYQSIGYIALETIQAHISDFAVVILEPILEGHQAKLQENKSMREIKIYAPPCCHVHKKLLAEY